MKKTIFCLLTMLGTFVVFTEKALAICPLCTVAVGAGIGLSRWLGIDDFITGLWIGGLIVSLIVWTLDWFDRKNIRFKGKTIIVVLGYYVLILVPLHFIGIIGNPLDTLQTYGTVDKLLLGIIVGSIAFWLSTIWHFKLKEKNQGRVYFPFQKVVIPVGLLVLLSIIFYLLTKYIV